LGAAIIAFDVSRVQKLSVWLYFTISALDNESGVSGESVPGDPRSV
jgi:hypothetical protein